MSSFNVTLMGGSHSFLCAWMWLTPTHV